MAGKRANPSGEFRKVKVVCKLTLRASLSVLTSAWCNKEFWKLYDSRRKVFYSKLWDGEEEMIITELRTLPVPQEVMEQLIQWVRPVGLQLKQWFLLNNYLHVNELNLVEILCWDCKGFINFQETAHKLIDNEPKLSAVHRFKLAATFCMEKHIFELWPVVKDEMCANLSSQEEPLYVLYWIYHFMNRMDELEKRVGFPAAISDPYNMSFVVVVMGHNFIFCEHFLDKPGVNKYEVIYNHCNCIIINNLKSLFHIVIHFFSKLNARDQEALLRHNPLDILLELSCWTYHAHFLDAARKVWKELEPKQYFLLLNRICLLVIKFNENPEYMDIFENLWFRMCTPRNRAYVMDMCINKTFLSKLCNKSNMKCVVLLIFRRATVGERHDMVMSLNGILLLAHLVSCKKWEFIQLLVQECLFVNDTDKLEKMFFQYLKNCHPPVVLQKEDETRFSEILNLHKKGEGMDIN